MRTIKLGYQFDFRNPPGSGRSFADLYSEMFRQAERVEELGFDSLWLTEHHFTDDVSRGRLRLGLGLGYRHEEFEGFDIPRNERLGRTLETIEILRRAWTG